jgi:hypothetical protein
LVPPAERLLSFFGTPKAAIPLSATKDTTFTDRSQRRVVAQVDRSGQQEVRQETT